MYLRSITLTNFRCFERTSLKFDAPISLLIGANGSGKTSILEALHYACYFKSFKTHYTKELIKIGTDSFNIKVEIDESDLISIGFIGNKKTIKFNNANIDSLKDHYSRYSAVTLCEDDLEIIKGSPESRRSFIDQLVVMHEPALLQVYRNFKVVQENRNALLQSHKPAAPDVLRLWTQELYQVSLIIMKKRIELLNALEQKVNALLENFHGIKHLDQARLYKTKFVYQSQLSLFDGQQPDENFDKFFDHYLINFHQREMLFKRSLFGAHLDDFSILLNDKNCRQFASRGQQKLLVLILKMAALRILTSAFYRPIFLLDDYLTDLDSTVLSHLSPLLTSSATQLVITAPHYTDLLATLVSSVDCQRQTLG